MDEDKETRSHDAADNVKPYVERAMTDEKLREDVLRAFGAARELYSELIGDRDGAITLASRVATDDEIRDKLRDGDRGPPERQPTGSRASSERTAARNSTLLVAGIALGILFNPVTGPETRTWIKELLGGERRVRRRRPVLERRARG